MDKISFWQLAFAAFFLCDLVVFGIAFRCLLDFSVFLGFVKAPPARRAEIVDRLKKYTGKPAHTYSCSLIVTSVSLVLFIISLMSMPYVFR